MSINHALLYLTWGVANKAKEEGCADKGRKTSVGIISKQEVRRGKGVRWRAGVSAGQFPAPLFAYWKMLVVYVHVHKKYVY